MVSLVLSGLIPATDSRQRGPGIPEKPREASYPQEESENLSYTSGTFIGTAEDAVNGSSESHEEGEGKLPHRA